MSKLNINKNEWLELVFEGKNKSYGAYQLRQEDGKTTMKAFFSAIVLISGIAVLPVVLSSFADAPVVLKPTICNFPITPVNLQPKKEEPKKEDVVVKKSEPKVPNKFAIPVVVKKEETPKTETPKNENINNNSTSNTPSTGTGVGPNIGNIDNGTVITVPLEDPNEIKPPATLDINPNFPGGIDEFLKTVGRKFIAPEIDEEKTMKIIVYFVVEKDGTLSNITVPKKTGYGLDIEAIRVLKSIKTKWEPGIYKGKPVRTSYSLPILIKMQQEQN